ncbi:hypothetical protein P7H47_11745 [Enterococcus cecorum]|uniref:BppU N-terminal domain-containing protein n=1 Tax=Enterococcus cecorum TaxID=44008 RepID=A0AAW8TYF3_9ENTE|nr:hypothetical protein [Enterococcus cecorum]MDT2797905.1 hypothetical protein [Enterococcus cecorum]
MNSLNLRQVSGGDTIKQADFGSELAFELLDEQYVKFREPLGEAAKVILKKDNIAIYQTSVTIVNNTVSFKFDKILPVGSYVLEIIVGDYVFPSNNRVIITVEQTYGDFEPEYLVKVSYEELKADVDDLKSKVTALEERLTVDTALTERVEALERKEDKDTVYDDTPIIKRVETLEDKPDNDTIYDDSNLKAQISELQEKLKSLNTFRRAPTGYTLDRTTIPWTVWFDNGCGMTIPEYGTTASIYGYGQGQNAYSNNFSAYPLPPTIMSVSHGTLTIEKIKTIEGSCNFWASGITIINPIRDRNDYDWTNARFNKASLDYAGDPYYSYKYVRQQYFIRTMYELGIWSGEIVEEFGATKK